MDAARNDEITAPTEVADTFVELTRQVNDVTLCFEGIVIHHPVTVVSVDRAFGTCVLGIPKQKDIARLLKAGRAFNVHAREQSCSLHSAMMACSEIISARKQIRLRCALPEVIEVVWDRNDFRVTLGQDMRVTVVLRAPDASLWHAWMSDLSMGGCLLRMPAADAVGLKTGEVRYRLSARFPSGEKFEIGARIKNYRVGDSGKYMDVGLAFDIESHAEKRSLRFYVGELERESARRTRRRSELRALAPSRLFPAVAGAKKPEHKRRSTG